jgi:hypothetical protein
MKSFEDELIQVWRNCSAPNWDGDDAIAVSLDSFKAAYRFIQALPLGCSSPSIGAEPDGHITLEWYKHPYWVLSVSISPEGMLYYAALFGNRNISGSESFSGMVSTELLSLIEKAMLDA